MHNTAPAHSLTTLGTLFAQSLQIAGLSDLELWGADVQAHIEAAERNGDPVLESLVRLKEMTYQKWVKLNWSGPRQTVGSREKC